MDRDKDIEDNLAEGLDLSSNVVISAEGLNDKTKNVRKRLDLYLERKRLKEQLGDYDEFELDE